MTLTKNEIVQWFMLSFPRLVRSMQQSDHNFDKNSLNPYHLEGPVWSHVCMVTQAARDDYHYVLAALLHDIGKPVCEERVKDKKRVRFFGHEPMSAFLALDVMKKFEEDFPDYNLNKKALFQVISMHTEPFKLSNDKLDDRLVNQSKWMIKLLAETNEADAAGRFYIGNGDRSWIPHVKTRKIEEKPKTATVLVGLPCSGKTTYVKSLNPERQTSVISRDDILAKFPGKDYNEKWKNANQNSVDQEFQKWKDKCLKSGDDLVFDMTHMSRKSRRRSLNGLPKDYFKKAVVFLPTLTEIMRRNENRAKDGKYIGEEVYEKMIKSFYPPMYDEFDEIIYRFD